MPTPGCVCARRIGQLLKEGKLTNIIGVPTSIRTYEQAKSLGIPLATLDEQPKLDVAIDGADEVDPNLDVVKGRGGALLREKMVEMASAKFVCIVDDSKMVTGLGGSKLAMPVEIVQFCHLYTLKRLQELPQVCGPRMHTWCMGPMMGHARPDYQADTRHMHARMGAHQEQSGARSGAWPRRRHVWPACWPVHARSAS